MMRILKITVISIVILIVVLILISRLPLLFLIPYKVQSYFNRITVEEAKQLAKDCKIKKIGIPHNADVSLTLVDGTTKYLSWENQIEASKLLISQKDCNFSVEFVIQ